MYSASFSDYGSLIKTIFHFILHLLPHCFDEIEYHSAFGNFTTEVIFT